MNKNKSFLIIVIFFCSKVFSFSEIPRGVSIGDAIGVTSKPGLGVESMNLYHSEPQRVVPSRNTVAEIPLFVYSSKMRLNDNQIRLFLSPVSFVWQKGANLGPSWHYGTFNPVFFGGLVHPITPNFGIAGYVGAVAPMRSGIINNYQWTFLNVNSISYVDDGMNLTLTSFYGHRGKDLALGYQNKPNFLNLDFTCTKILSGIEVGPVAFFTRDLNRKNAQQRLAIGGLVGKKLLNDWYLQLWFGHDTFAYNYPRQNMIGYLRLKNDFPV